MSDRPVVYRIAEVSQIPPMHQHSTFALKGHIQRGDPAPWWNQGDLTFAFDSAAGRYIVLSFYGTARDAIGESALAALQDNRHLVDSGKAGFFCVCTDLGDRTELRVDARYPSLQFLWDTDTQMHRAYGVTTRMWIVLDPMLRVLELIPFSADGAHINHLLAFIERLPNPFRILGFEAPTPVLMLPDVFEAELCRYLIDRHQANGARESGFMQELNGIAVETYDPAWKRRTDYIIADAALIEPIEARMARRIGTMLQKVFHFKLSRIERHLIACYSAEDGGHFGSHRDDTVKATQHRRFAVSINLNDDFDGGEVSFPEFSDRRFKAPIGAALIFSSSLLHRVAKVTRGRRYAFLPFCHDEEAEKVRIANLRFLLPPAPAPVSK
jgi:predicted 2-oxoglutarate/Fe(II)-dependent dioxygenase YbiX